MRGRRRWVVDVRAMGAASGRGFWRRLGVASGSERCEALEGVRSGAGRTWTMDRAGRLAGFIGIEHESLILAQNERWRHA